MHNSQFVYNAQVIKIRNSNFTVDRRPSPPHLDIQYYVSVLAATNLVRNQSIAVKNAAALIRKDLITLTVDLYRSAVGTARIADNQF